MRIAELLDLFRSRYDNYGSNRGLEQVEVIILLNSAQRLTINKILYYEDDRMKRSNQQAPTYGFENVEYSTEDLNKLLVVNQVFTPNNQGVLTFDVIRAVLPGVTIRSLEGVAGPVRKSKIEHIMNVSRWNGSTYRSSKWRRHNEIRSVENDLLRVPTDKYPSHTIGGDAVQFYPQTDNQVRISLIREPQYMWLGDNISVNPELSDRLMEEVVEIAMQLASGSVRDFQAYQLYKDRELSQ